MQLIDEVGIACDILDQVWGNSIGEQATIEAVAEINGADTLAGVLTNIFGTTVTEIDKLCDEMDCNTLTDTLANSKAYNDGAANKVMSNLQTVIDDMDCRDNWDLRDSDSWDAMAGFVTDAMVYINKQQRLNSDLIKEEN